VAVALAALALVASLGGCGRGALLDERNIYYIRGMKLREAKKNDEAVDAFQTCLRLSPQSALAHLQLAMIYDQTLDDPLSAVYHYRRFLEMRPDHPDAEAVKAWSAKAELKLVQRLQQAAVYAAISQGGADVQVPDTAGPTARELALLARVQELTETNEDLRKALHEPVVDPALLPAAPAPVAAPLPAPTAKAETQAVPTTPAAPAPTAAAAKPPPPAAAVPASVPAAPSPGPSPTPPSPAVVAAPPAAAAERTHLVAAGDTLSSLCRRYYGTSAYWPQLRQANQDLLGDRNDLKVGMRLRIPPLAQLKPTSQTPRKAR
jgi:nucleoid-associated protein YgaU